LNRGGLTPTVEIPPRGQHYTAAGRRVRPAPGERAAGALGAAPRPDHRARTDSHMLADIA